MATATEVLTVPIRGMTCDHCVQTVRKALEGVPGVRSAAVDLKAGRAEVTVEGGSFDRSLLKAAVEAAGYTVPAENGSTPPAGLVTIGSPKAPERAAAPEQPEELDLAIGGMHCASCVTRVEHALASVPGVREARVNLATERASVRLDPHHHQGVSFDALAQSVAHAGYTARLAAATPAEEAAALRRDRAEQVAYWRRRLIVGAALTLPLVILGYAPMLTSAHWVHARWVGWAMLALATPLQIYLGGPYLRGAWERLRQGSSNMDTLIALGTSTAFGYSLFHLIQEQGSAQPTAGYVLGGVFFLAVLLIGALGFGQGAVNQPHH